jgi:hypothetical protein
VHLAHARPRDDVANVVLANSATGHDGYAITSLLYQSSDDIDALQSRSCAARSQDATHADLNETFQRFSEIRREIQRPVKGDGRPRTRRDQLACSRHVYACVAIESADHDSRCAVLTSDVDIALHYIDFVGRINEVTTTRSNEHEYRNPHTLDYSVD